VGGQHYTSCAPERHLVAARAFPLREGAQWDLTRFTHLGSVRGKNSTEAGTRVDAMAGVLPVFYTVLLLLGSCTVMVVAWFNPNQCFEVCPSEANFIPNSVLAAQANLSLARYLHLKYEEWPMWKAILFSWLIAGAEYCLQVHSILLQWEDAKLAGRNMQRRGLIVRWRTMTSGSSQPYWAFRCRNVSSAPACDSGALYPRGFPRFLTICPLRTGTLQHSNVANSQLVRFHVPSSCGS